MKLGDYLTVLWPASMFAYSALGTASVHAADNEWSSLFFFKLDGDAGCDPQDTQTTHSQGLAALANVSAPELSEARTDPATPGAWYDSQGQENGDKCAWTFNVPYVTFPNGRLPEPRRAKGMSRRSLKEGAAQQHLFRPSHSRGPKICPSKTGIRQRALCNEGIL
jgi:hypothetical protein